MRRGRRDERKDTMIDVAAGYLAVAAVFLAAALMLACGVLS